MKKLLFIFGFLFFTNLSFGQSATDSLVQAGIEYHDSGQYEKAIETYKKALEIEPSSPLINYEIALTYMYAGDYESSIRHSDLVIASNNDFSLQAYITKGSCLDYLGKTEESIKLFEKGIKEFGDDHLLYYNLGYNYYKLKNFEKAREALINAINTKPGHASSHLLLGYTMYNVSQKVPSLLCLYYFLLLEPDSERAVTAYKLLKDQFSGGVSKDKKNPNQTNILVDAGTLESEFGSAELMISMLEASKSIEKNKDKSEEELFIKNTTSFFQVLGELNKKKNKGLWWEFYVPFFYEMTKSEHMDTYCYYISSSSNETAVEWLDKNRDKIDKFSEWLEAQN